MLSRGGLLWLLWFGVLFVITALELHHEIRSVLGYFGTYIALVLWIVVAIALQFRVTYEEKPRA